MNIQFSGTVGQVSEAFHTTFHSYQLNGRTEYSVIADPQVPSAFANVITSVTNLDSFSKAKPALSSLTRLIYQAKMHEGTSQWTTLDGVTTAPIHLLSPGDFATEYDVKQAYANGVNGAGQTIAVVEDSNIDLQLVNAYRKLFGLPYNPPEVVIDGNDPGINEDSAEAYIDVENAGAIAPNATVRMYVAGTQGLSGGGGIDFAITQAIDDDIAQVISVSFYSPEYAGTPNNAFYANSFEQAAAQGQTVIVATGDTGVAGPFGLSVNGIASNPWNIAVGGTDVYVDDYATGGPSMSQYWSPNYDADYNSLLKPIAEQPWNASQFGLNNISYTPVAQQLMQALGSGGGASYCAVGAGAFDPQTKLPICTKGWPKPSWQAGPGVPTDGVRDFPDVSLFGSNGANGVRWPICAEAGDCSQSAATDNLLFITGAGGTSASAPAMAGIMALINQKYGPQGQADYILYPLAVQFPSTFTNMAIGSNNEPCAPGTNQCSLDQNDNYYSYQRYYAHPGYNQAAGLGSIDVTKLLANWQSVSLHPTKTSLTLSATEITHGESITANVVVQGNGEPSGNVSLIATPAPPNNSGQGYTPIVNGAGHILLTSLPGGTYTVYANYGGDGINAASQSDSINLIVTPESSKSTITATAYSSGPGTSVQVFAPGAALLASSEPTFDIHISNATGVADGIATGTVTYAINGATVGVQQLDTAGIAEWKGADLGVGTYTLSSVYSGDVSFLASKGPDFEFSIAQMPAPSLIILPDPSCTSGPVDDICVANTNVTFTGIVPVASFDVPAPTGTLTFALGNNQPVAIPLGANISSYPGAGEGSTSSNITGVIAPVSFTNLQSTSSNPGGLETLTVTYSGDANYASSKSIVNLIVAGSSLSSSETSIMLTSPASPTAVAPGTLLTLNATVAGNASVPPTGTVTLHDGYGLTLAEAALSPGFPGMARASVTVREEQLLAGDNFLTFVYSGDSVYLPGSSGTLNIPKPYGDFTLITADSNVVLENGGAVKVPLTVLSDYNFTGVVALSCSAPDGLTCVMADSSISASTGGSNTSLTIGSVTYAGNRSKLIAPPEMCSLGLSPLIAILLVAVGPRRRRLAGRPIRFLFSLAIIPLLGCGQQIISPATASSSTYTVLVTGISSAGTHNLPIIVTVR